MVKIKKVFRTTVLAVLFLFVIQLHTTEVKDDKRYIISRFISWDYNQFIISAKSDFGAFIFTSICGALIEFLRNYFKKYTDLILAIVLSLSVGTAISLISSGKMHANADSFMFGSVLTVTRTDMYLA